MAKWKRLEKTDDIIGKNILLRESYFAGKNISYYAGVLTKDVDDTHWILTSFGNIEIFPDEYTYYFLFIDEIEF